MAHCDSVVGTPSSIFLEESTTKLSLLEMAMDYLSQATSRRNSRKYNNISLEEEAKSFYKPK